MRHVYGKGISCSEAIPTCIDSKGWNATENKGVIALSM